MLVDGGRGCLRPPPWNGMPGLPTLPPCLGPSKHLPVKGNSNPVCALVCGSDISLLWGLQHGQS